MSLSKIIYVWEEKDNSGNYFLVETKENEIGEDRVYGIYELKEKKKMVFERKPVKVK